MTLPAHIYFALAIAFAISLTLNAILLMEHFADYLPDFIRNLFFEEK